MDIYQTYLDNLKYLNENKVNKEEFLEFILHNFKIENEIV